MSNIKSLLINKFNENYKNNIDIVEEIQEEANPILAPILNKQRINRLNSANIVIGNLKTLNVDIDKITANKPINNTNSNNDHHNSDLNFNNHEKNKKLQSSDSAERMSPQSIKNIQVKKCHQFINFSNSKNDNRDNRDNKDAIDYKNNKLELIIADNIYTPLYNKSKIKDIKNNNLDKSQISIEKDKETNKNKNRDKDKVKNIIII